jgi:hypothetical protein
MRGLKSKIAIICELLGFLWAAKLWWMIPVVVVLLSLGGLMVLAQSSAIAPLIYTLF